MHPEEEAPLSANDLLSKLMTTKWFHIMLSKWTNEGVQIDFRFIQPSSGSYNSGNKQNYYKFAI